MHEKILHDINLNHLECAVVTPSRWTRREMLAATGQGFVAANILMPRSGFAQGNHAQYSRVAGTVSVLDPAIVIDGTDVRVLAQRALEAATAAGATYADVRLTRLLQQKTPTSYGAWLGVSAPVMENERLGIGVRVHAAGGWGFSASPYWDETEVIALAKSAVIQAKANSAANAKSSTRGMALNESWKPIPVASGTWKTPILVDPFTISLEEKTDLLSSWSLRTRRYGGETWSDWSFSFTREERAIATTEGTYVTQTFYTSGGEFSTQRESFVGGQQHWGRASLPGLGPTAAGWELFTEAKISSQIVPLYAGADPDAAKPPVRPGDIGRYDVVMDAATMASLVGKTIGTAAQVDRALGYEANAGGTSYLGPDPLALLGTHQVASSLVTVTADRSMPRGLATAQWDDEGVMPQPVALVKDGVLMDYQTTREQAAWLAPYYEKRGIPAQSRGCARSESALHVTMQQMPNLTLEPGIQDLGFNALVADTARGIAIMGGDVSTDFQQRNGTGRGLIREIVNGQLGAVLSGLDFMFNTIQLWKNLTSIGGRGSVEQFALTSIKGEPAQSASYSVRAVPGKFTKVDFFNPLRRA